ncbi:hypothetical protein V8F20_007300 [Naviculisporaceae sp. PSN 640]
MLDICRSLFSFFSLLIWKSLGKSCMIEAVSFMLLRSAYAPSLVLRSVRNFGVMISVGTLLSYGMLMYVDGPSGELQPQKMFIKLGGQ